jgi:hypothetical protein
MHRGASWDNQCSKRLFQHQVEGPCESTCCRRDRDIQINVSLVLPFTSLLCSYPPHIFISRMCLHCTHTDTHRHTQTHTDTHRHKQTHTQTQTHTHTDTDTHTHTHTHTCPRRGFKIMAPTPICLDICHDSFHLPACEFMISSRRITIAYAILDLHADTRASHRRQHLHFSRFWIREGGRPPLGVRA